MATGLEIAGLTKRYGRSGQPANDDVTLQVRPGEVFGLLGHNGAGKTTLVNQVVGLLRPDTGTILIDGADVVARPGLARRACTIQPQAQAPIAGLSPRRAIELIGRLRGSDRAAATARLADLAAALDIEEWLDRDGARLSGGVKRLVAFCMAAVAPGRVVILDEPTNDVDPVRRRLLWRQVRRLADEGTAVLLVTHNVVEAERAVDRLAILDHGRVLAEGTPAELKTSTADELRLELVWEPGREIEESPAWARRSIDSGQRSLWTLASAHASEAAAFAQALRRDGLVEEFSLTAATLEDAYVALVEGTGAPDEQEESDVRAA